MILQDLFSRHERANALALLGYGAAGLLVLISLGTAIAPALSAADAFARSSNEVSAALSASVDAFDGFGTSLTEARASAERAADTASGSAAVARDLADRMSIGIFGVQPLLPLSQSFRRQGDELDALSRELSDLAAALGRNERDVVALRSSVAVIRDRIGVPGAAAAGAGVGPLVYAALAWLALPSILSLAAGVALWRDLSSRQAIVSPRSRAA